MRDHRRGACRWYPGGNRLPVVLASPRSIPHTAPNTLFPDGNELVDVTILAARDGIYFKVRNLSDHTIRLLWDEAAYVGIDGSADRVMHYGVRYADRNLSHPPSVIPRGSIFEDAAFPSRRVELVAEYDLYGFSMDWVHHSLILPVEVTIEGGGISPAFARFQQEAEAHLGKRIGLLLPFEVEGVLNEYTFWFRVDDVIVGEAATLLASESDEPAMVRFPGAPFSVPEWAGFIAAENGRTAYALVETCDAWYDLKEDEVRYFRDRSFVRQSGLRVSTTPGCSGG